LAFSGLWRKKQAKREAETCAVTVIFTDEQKTATGKIPKHMLRERAGAL